MLLLTDDHLLLNQEMTDDDVCGDVDYNGQMIEVKILKLLVLLEVETHQQMFVLTKNKAVCVIDKFYLYCYYCCYKANDELEIVLEKEEGI